MSEKLIESVTSIAVAIVGIAIIAVLVSNKAQTGSVIGAAGQAFAQDIGAAVSPVTGGNVGTGIPQLGSFSGGAGNVLSI